MHSILLILDPQENKCKYLPKDKRDEFVYNICDRIKTYAEMENCNILGTIDKRFISDSHPFIIKEIKDTIVDLQNVHIPIQNKSALGSLQVIENIINMYNIYKNTGGLSVEICGTNEEFQALIAATTLKSLVPEIDVSLNLSCMSCNVHESMHVSSSIGIHFVE